MSRLPTRVDTVFIPVKDLHRARDWYRDHLGLPVQWETDGYVCLETGGTTAITLAQAREVHPSPHPILNLFTPDIEPAHRALSEQGLDTGLIQEASGVRWFTFSDPDGHLLGVCSW